MTPPQQPPARLSPIDSQRFGITVGRADRVTTENLEAVVSFCEGEGVDLLVARCPAQDVRAVQAMVEAGFRFMDGEVHYRGPVGSGGLAGPVTTTVRPARPEERSQVVELAGTCFKGFMGHYHADARLDPEQCDEVYRSWADRCCTGDAADVVVVAVLDGAIGGFSAFRAVSESEGQLVLGAVAPWANGRGLYGQMTLDGAGWCRRRELQTLLAITQLGNLASQRTWAALGMKPSATAYTFHRWFDGTAGSGDGPAGDPPR